MIYVQSSIPHQAFGDKPPKEVVTSVKSKVGHPHMIRISKYGKKGCRFEADKREAKL